MRTCISQPIIAAPFGLAYASVEVTYPTPPFPPFWRKNTTRIFGRDMVEKEPYRNRPFKKIAFEQWKRMAIENTSLTKWKYKKKYTDDKQKPFITFISTVSTTLHISIHLQQVYTELVMSLNSSSTVIETLCFEKSCWQMVLIFQSYSQFSRILWSSSYQSLLCSWACSLQPQHNAAWPSLTCLEVYQSRTKAEHKTVGLTWCQEEKKIPSCY